MYAIVLDAAKLDNGKLAQIIDAANAGRRCSASKLRGELLRCEAYYRADVERRSKPSDERKGRAQIINRAKRLKDIVGDDEYLDRLITNASGPLPDQWPEPLEIGTMGGGRSAADMLIRRLADVFMKCFPGQRARQYSTDPLTGAIKSNFVDFAKTVLVALEITTAGEPYARKTILRALDRKSRK